MLDARDKFTLDIQRAAEILSNERIKGNEVDVVRSNLAKKDENVLTQNVQPTGQQNKLVMERRAKKSINSEKLIKYISSAVLEMNESINSLLLSCKYLGSGILNYTYSTSEKISENFHLSNPKVTEKENSILPFQNTVQNIKRNRKFKTITVRKNGRKQILGNSIGENSGFRTLLSETKPRAKRIGAGTIDYISSFRQDTIDMWLFILISLLLILAIINTFSASKLRGKLKINRVLEK